MVMTLAVGCTPAMVPPPTLAQAQALFAQAVKDAQAGRYDALCAVGGGNCKRILNEAGNVPDAAPRIVGHRVQQPTSTRHGGIVLEICGKTNTGDPYYTEMVVFRDTDDRLIAIEPVYWSGYGIADGPIVGPTVGDPAARCK